MKPATIAVLLYGDHHDLHRRCLTSILQTVPDDIQIRVGLNAVCEETLTWLESGQITPQLLIPGTLQAGVPEHGVECDRFLFYSSRNQNIKKYPMMRRMFYDDPLTSKWVIWFDDDTHIANPESKWWEALTGPEFFGKKGVVYIGEPWTAPYLPGQWPFVKNRIWWRGLAPQIVNGMPSFVFHTGGFVAIKRQALKQLAWPDGALVHNGGDTLLGEAVRQQDWPVTAFPTYDHGIMVNDAPRRGYRETPVGSTATVLR